MRISTISLAAALALACGLAQAQGYRWVDKDGKVRYGDVVPPGVKATPLKPPSGGGGGGGGAPSTAANPASKDKSDKDKADAKKGPLTPAQQEQAYRERQAKAKEDREKADKEQAQAEQRKQNCAQAQESLRSMELGRRMSTVNAQGEVVVLDDAQVQERIARARQSVAESCK